MCIRDSACAKNQIVADLVDCDCGTSLKRLLKLGNAKIAHPNVRNFALALQRHEITEGSLRGWCHYLKFGCEFVGARGKSVTHIKLAIIHYIK